MTTEQRTLLSSWGLFVAVLLLMVGNGLTSVLLGVRSELEGFDTTTTGFVMASYFAGFLVGSQVAPRIMARVGHIRVFAGLSSLVAASSLAHALWVAPAPWIFLRLVFGFSMAGLYVVAESWLNDAVTNSNRGRVMGVYMVVAMGGLGLGQMLIGAGDPAGQSLFLIAGALVALAVVPVSLSGTSAPAFVTPPRLKPREIWEAAPLGIVGALGTGIANGALIGMAGVYATQVGLPPGRTALFVGAAAIGSVVLQWPVGFASDILGRRRSMLFVTLLAAAAAAMAAGLPPDGPAILFVMFLFGGFTFPMYSLSLSHVIDVLPAGRAVTASVAVVFVTGVGAIFGPLSASLAMSAFGPAGFFWTMATVHLAIGLYAIVRIVRRPVIKGMTPKPYVLVPARSTILLRLGRRTKKPGKGAG